MITIYGKPSCPFCVKAKDLAESSEFLYEYVDLNVDDSQLSKIKADGFSSIPAIYDGDFIIGGFQEFEKFVYKLKNNVDI